MRDIKFRAWDKIDKRLIIDKQDFIPLVVTNKGVFKLDPTCEYDRWIEIDKNRFDFMQYTGLKDKNGVEIYDGDILKYPYVRSSSVNYAIEIGVIEWSDEYCGFIIDEVQNIGGFCGIESKHMNEIEVIGNIYENPELL